MNPNRNPVGWFEIYVADMDRARSFYEAVFETKLEKLDAPGMEMWVFPIPAGGEGCQGELPGAAGALVRMEGKDPGCGGVIIYFSCLDCADEASRAARNGGSIQRDKFSIGPYGHIAFVMDTEGNLIGLHSMR